LKTFASSKPCHTAPFLHGALGAGARPLLAFLLLVASTAAAFEPAHLSLAGQWLFELDRSDVCIQQKWFNRPLVSKINLPGSLPAQGIGEDISVDTKWTGEIVDKSWFTATEYAVYRQPGNVKVPFWLQPEKYYAGAAWYQRDIDIPAEWSSKRVVLTLERPHWETRVWIDGKALGSNDSLSTPHEYDLGSVATGRHRLTIRVDNGLVVDIGVNSHSISDHTQGNWNGIVGRIELRVTPRVWLEQVTLYPSSSNGEFRVAAAIGNSTGEGGQGKLSVWLAPGSTNKAAETKSQTLAEIPVRWSSTGAVVECNCSLPISDRALWDEFTPNLHPLLVELSSGDVKSESLGVRQISSEGTQFLIN